VPVAAAILVAVLVVHQIQAMTEAAGAAAPLILV